MDIRSPEFVIPANVGIQATNNLDTRIRGYDGFFQVR
jgi:hypothetical protein